MEASTRTNIRILLVDDHPLMRRALRDILESEPDLEVVGETSDGLQALEMTEQHRPDVVIMDINMPRMNGMEATKLIKASNPQIVVLILTVYTDVVTIFSILQAGAGGYLVKSILGPEVIHTIRAVIEGDVVLSPEVSQQVVKYACQRAGKRARPAAMEGLSATGVEILSLVAKGLSNKEIGVQLGITETTVKRNLVAIFQKLDVRSRTEAIFVSLKSGILTLDDLG